jgi:hypothetical protein
VESAIKELKRVAKEAGDHCDALPAVLLLYDGSSPEFLSYRGLSEEGDRYSFQYLYEYTG